MSAPRAQSFSDCPLWFPGFIGRRTGSVGPAETRHALHRGCAAVCHSFVRRARAADLAPVWTLLDEAGADAGALHAAEHDAVSQVVVKEMRA